MFDILKSFAGQTGVYHRYKSSFGMFTSSLMLLGRIFFGYKMSKS